MIVTRVACAVVRARLASARLGDDARIFASIFIVFAIPSSRENATKRRCDNSDDEDSDADDNDARKKAKHHEDRTHGRWCDRLAMQIKDVNHDRLQDVVLRFYIDELIAAGVLTPTTTELVLTADLIDGRQIEVRASVRAR